MVNKTQCGITITGDDEYFLFESISSSNSFKSFSLKPGIKFKVTLKKFQARKVRGVVIITPNSKREVWVGKEKIINDLFPKTTKISESRQNRNDALKALRQIVEPQIQTFRKSARKILDSEAGFSEKCPLSGELLRNCKGDTHVDHVYPFSLMVEDFCRAYKLDLERVEVLIRGTKVYLKDTNLAEAWWDFHMMKAKLQLTCGKANIQKSNKYFGD